MNILKPLLARNVIDCALSLAFSHRARNKTAEKLLWKALDGVHTNGGDKSNQLGLLRGAVVVAKSPWALAAECRDRQCDLSLWTAQNCPRAALHTSGRRPYLCLIKHEK